MTPERVFIHQPRCCANCAHVSTDAATDCWQRVSLVDGSAKPADFACGEHQTAGEFRLDLHRPSNLMLLPV